ncbi:MAG: S-layer family protein [Sedimentisphaerales bacterium]|nr:S-layer family protein [Sedimentisphaerales bacterium]
MFKKSFLLISVVLMLSLAGNASAVNVWWLGSNSNWFDADNYSNTAVPATDTGVNWSVSGLGSYSTINISSGDAVCYSLWSYNEHNSHSKMYVSGGTLTGYGDLTVGVGSSTGDSTFYVSGGTVDFPSYYIRVGRALGAGQTGTGSLNITGGTVKTPSIVIPYIPTYSANSRVELYGGTLDVNAITMATGGVIDIEKGTLIVDGNVVSTVQGYVDNDKIIAYNDTGTVVIDYDNTNPGRTTVTAWVARTWYGNDSSSWSDANNFSPAGSPASCDTVNFSYSGTPDAGSNKHMLAIEDGNITIAALSSYNPYGHHCYMTMTGGILNTGSLTLGSYSDGGGSTFNLTGGTITISGANSYLNVGRDLDPNGGGAGVLNMTGGTITTPWLRMYDSAVGIINLMGGTFTVTSTMNQCSEDMINITEGKLVWTGDHRSDVNSYIASGIIKGYGENGTVDVNYTGGNTEVTATGFYYNAVISWGDVIITWGADTDAAFDSPEGIENMIKRWKGRGYTGICLRSDCLKLDDTLTHWNEGILPTTALIMHVQEDLASQFNILQTASEAAQSNGFEFWAWVPTVYSRGAPAYFEGSTFPWSYEDKAIYDDPDLLTISRDGDKCLYMVSEFAYDDAISTKVDEFEYYAKNYGIKNFIASMRSEAAQCQAPPLKADEFGFNQPVVDDMLTLHDVNILTDFRFDAFDPNFDPCDSMVENWHNLRGTYLTEFFTDLRDGMDNIDPAIRLSTEIQGGHYLGSPMGNIKADWAKWVDDGLIQELIIYFALCGTGEVTEDPNVPYKDYLTSREYKIGILEKSVFRDAIDESNHPDTRLTNGWGQSPFPPAPYNDEDGWRSTSSAMYDAYCLGWYQRWEQ